MSDLTKPDGGLTVEERLALLEARLAPAPQVVVPPITVGSLNNVPVPGGQIAAQWAQDVTGIALHRFASKASLDAWAAPVGARAITTNDNLEWRRVAGGWSRITPWSASAAGVAIPFLTPAGTYTLATINVPADPGPRIATLSACVRVDRYTPSPASHLQLLNNGGLVAQWDAEPLAIDLTGVGLQTPYWVSLICSTGPSNAVSTMALQYVGEGNQTTILANPAKNRLDVTVLPI